MDIVIQPIAIVKNVRTIPTDDNWGEIVSAIELVESIPEAALAGIAAFSHLEIIYHFDRVASEIVYSRRPRGNPEWPEVGIFGQRNKDRPNRLGLCVVELVEVRARTLVVRKLDAIDGTPVVDIKPVFREFLPQGEVQQPDWVGELMGKYW